MTLINGLLLAVLTITIAALVLSQWRIRALMRKLDLMLDKALSGSIPESYDEDQLSKLETKLLRFLSASKLRRGQIEKEQRSVHTLIGDISHQTKTPIANILLYSQLLTEAEADNPQTMELISQVSANAEKLSFLIQALVKTSRLESGVLTVVPERQEIAELIVKSLLQIHTSARAKDIEIRFKAPTSPIYALYDLKWCTEAMFNILDNAVKYTPKGGAITIDVKAYEMFIRIDISDTGIGIPKNELAQIFGRFWRGAGNAGIEGVGIGLFLAREIVSQCGGYIKASSTGQGAVFSVFLPKISPNLSKL